MRLDPPATLSRESFGAVAGEPVERITLSNGHVRIGILTYGGILQSIDVPDRDGQFANVTLGFGDLQQYVGSNAYFGALIGRFANRIARGQFTLDGVRYHVPVNDGPNCLHGGAGGFHTRVWQATDIAQPDGVGLRLTLHSRDGDQGFPGALSVEVTCTLDRSTTLRLDYRATSDRTTVLNLTNHAYFNLAGEGSGSIEDHVLTIPSDYYTPIDATLIPTGAIEPVAATPLDFRTPTPIGRRLRSGHEQVMFARGYDHNYVVRHTRAADDAADLTMAARVEHAASGRILEVWTTEPGLQFYSGNFLGGTLVGSGGRAYRQGDAFTLETQHFPDAPNQPGFPATILRPGEIFSSSTVYRFSTA